MKVRKTEDGFHWLIVDGQLAVSLFNEANIELYALYDDGSEALIETKEDLESHIEVSGSIAIALGFNPAESCPRCDSPLIPSCIAEYDWQCLSCDEDFYEVEL